MLTEIIPGEHYIREDGAKVVAQKYGNDGMLIAASRIDGEPDDDEWVRWASTGARPDKTYPDWDQNPIAGRFVRSEKDVERRRFNLVRLASDPLTTQQLELF